ncbi:hypothetical protein SynA1825c_01847 [Synechococcus sp. A18-25c]|nr:hypothetical protein SynA1825c_01847 [Synechococcus sp. A18-25c]
MPLQLLLLRLSFAAVAELLVTGFVPDMLLKQALKLDQRFDFRVKLIH